VAPAASSAPTGSQGRPLAPVVVALLSVGASSPHPVVPQAMATATTPTRTRPMPTFLNSITSWMGGEVRYT
jgi:poly-beta-hydroxyalkanoate depolymerase